jgi:prolipoprotein diacylglyceryltransferase
MTPAQIVSIVTVIAGLLLLWFQSRKSPPNDTPDKTVVPHKA